MAQHSSCSERVDTSIKIYLTRYISARYSSSRYPFTQLFLHKLPGRQAICSPSITTTTRKNQEFLKPSWPSGAATSLRPSTPWKSSSQFLDPPGSQHNLVPGIVLPDQGVEPNVLCGLGLINSGIWGDNWPLDIRHAQVYSGLQSGQPPTLRPIQASSDPKDQQVTSPMRGDTPSPNINNNPFPTGDHYRGHPLAGGYPG